MSEYQHSDDNNLKNLHKAMQYNSLGESVIRTGLGGVGIKFKLDRN
jgi:hypothetical protein